MRPPAPLLRPRPMRMHCAPLARAPPRPQTRSASSTAGVSALQERHARGCVGVAAQVVARAAAALDLKADGIEGVEWPVVD